MYSEYLMIGEVLKPQGIHGQVKVRPDTDDPVRFLALDQVFLKDGDQYKACAINNAEARADGFVYCVLNGASSREEAEKQRGWMLYVDRAHAVELEDGQYFISDLIDCKVLDRQGNLIGQLKDVLQPGANDVYQIKRTDGRMMYLPVLPFVILDVQVKQGIVTVDESRLPEVAVIED
ncbi:MAG: 16S rRNA processing protein RimM [Clostridia bacterium]|nr:16S rRNA processing protein RimM [Clostridia bacterium]